MKYGRKDGTLGSWIVGIVAGLLLLPVTSMPSLANTLAANARSQSFAPTGIVGCGLSDSKILLVPGFKTTRERFRERVGPLAGTTKTQAAVRAGLKWLADEQAEDGRWQRHGAEGEPGAHRDIGRTAIAMLALFGDGVTTRIGLHKAELVLASKWLRKEQDFESGRIGPAGHAHALRDHATATLAMTEAYMGSYSPILASSAQKALDYLASSRNADGLWSASGIPDAASDRATTEWALLAFRTGKGVGLRVNPETLTRGTQWFERQLEAALDRQSPAPTEPGKDKLTDPETIASGVLCHALIAEAPVHGLLTEPLSDLLLAGLPSRAAATIEDNAPARWYSGAYAMFQLGGEGWTSWDGEMKQALLSAQVAEGPLAGSWSPPSSGDDAGDRVTSTAMGVLCFEVYYRYTRRSDM